MAAFPTGIPGPGVVGGASQPQTPPPQVAGVTQTPSVPPMELMKMLARKPESAQQLVRQAIVMLENAAELDARIEPRIGAAVKILRGPAKPNGEP